MVDVNLLGLDFTDADPKNAAAAVAARPTGAPFAYVVTPNSDHLVRLARHPELFTLYDNAWMRLLDSRVVARAAAGIGLPVPRVTTGSDLTERLLRDHVRPGERITIVGLRREHLPGLMASCNLAAPAHYDPPMGFDRDPVEMQRTVDFVLANPSRLIFLAVGSPRQERLAAAIAATGRATGTALCIGASLDFICGAERRAPRWTQQAGLEWAYRLVVNPRRMARRYLLDNPPVFALLLRERLSRQPAARAGQSV